MYRKNTAGQFVCYQLLLTATGAVGTGLSPAVRRCIDGTFAAGGGTSTEDGTTGSYKYAMSQADTNGNNISFIFSAATAMPVCVNIVTTAGDPTDAVHFGLSSLPNAAANAAGGLPISAAGALDLDEMNVDIEAIQTSTAGLTYTVANQVDCNPLSWRSGTIPAVNVTGVPLVDLKYTLGTISPAAAGSVGIDWAQIANKGSAVNLSATQIQSVNNLAAGSDSINTIATSGSTLTTGSTVSGTFANTATLDGVYWQIADTAGTLDMYFEFNVGATGVPTTAVWTGGLTTAVDTLKVFAFNWAGSSWDQVGTLSGTSSLLISEQQYDFTTAHVGTGGNLGLVRLRFQATGLVTANFYTDQVLCGYTNVLTTAGIAAGVWQDTTAGDFTIAASIGKSVMNGVALGSGLHTALVDTVTTYTGNTPQTGDGFARLGAPVGASISADIAEVEAETDLIIASTSGLTFTVANQVDVNVVDWKGSAAPAMTGDAFARLGPPVGASISADIAAAPATLLDQANGIETGITVRQGYRVFLSAMGGKADGLATATCHYRDQADTKNRITATVDANGNRTAVTLDTS